MFSRINKEKSDFFNTLSDCKDMDTLIKMVQFYNNHLKERFPNVKKKDVFLAQLVNKEILYLQWKFEAIEGRIQHFEIIETSNPHHANY